MMDKKNVQNFNEINTFKNFKLRKNYVHTEHIDRSLRDSSLLGIRFISLNCKYILYEVDGLGEANFSPQQVLTGLRKGQKFGESFWKGSGNNVKHRFVRTNLQVKNLFYVI